jgi:hypothetical protein
MPLIITKGAGGAGAFGLTSLSICVPCAPTIGTASYSATAGTPGATASVAFTPPVKCGHATITSYTATSTPGSFTGTGSSSPVSISGLTKGTAYTFKVKATNKKGSSACSSASNSITPLTVPGAPTIGTATATGSSTATIAFTAPSCAGGASIDTYQAISSPGGITATGTSPITVSGLSPGTSYTFQVRAHNSQGYGGYSSSSGSITTTAVVGSVSYITPGTYTWVVPAGVTYASAVVIGAGGGGTYWDCIALRDRGGAGGDLRYINSVPVTPGTSHSVVVGGAGGPGLVNVNCPAGSSGYSLVCLTESASNYVRSQGGWGAYATQTQGNSSGVTIGGGNGGASFADAGSAGGGAGGYSGNGGYQYCRNTNGRAGSGGAGGSGAGGSQKNQNPRVYPSAGGGVGLFGQGSSGCGGTFSYTLLTGGRGGSGGCNGQSTCLRSVAGYTCCYYGGYVNGYTYWNFTKGGNYGGGSGSGAYFQYNCYVAAGAVRIVWPGNSRKFPSTCVGSP